MRTRPAEYLVPRTGLSQNVSNRPSALWRRRFDERMWLLEQRDFANLTHESARRQKARVRYYKAVVKDDVKRVTSATMSIYIRVGEERFEIDKVRQRGKKTIHST